MLSAPIGCVVSGQHCITSSPLVCECGQSILPSASESTLVQGGIERQFTVRTCWCGGNTSSLLHAHRLRLSSRWCSERPGTCTAGRRFSAVQKREEQKKKHEVMVPYKVEHLSSWFWCLWCIRIHHRINYRRWMNANDCVFDKGHQNTLRSAWGSPPPYRP